MAIVTVDQEVKRLRSYLNPLIRGTTVDAVLCAIATGMSTYLVNTVDQVGQQGYLATAQGIYLDSLTAEFNLTRPPEVGIGDDEYRQIAIQVKNTKAIRNLINQLLNIMFGDQLTKASSPSANFEPYNLADQDTLLVAFDDQSTVMITFDANEFSSIAAATAQEVADAITKSLSAMGVNGSAISQNDGNGNYVRIYSDAIGPASSVTVFGGSAQNVLVFDSPVGAGGNMSTQWTLTNQPGGFIRFTWTGGADPGLGKLTVGNYVNIFGGGFASSSNQGSYTITSFLGGTQGISYFEVLNPLGTPGIITQGSDNAVLFFNPVRLKVTSQKSFAAQFQVAPSTVQIFIPCVTKVVRRMRQGSAHLPIPNQPSGLAPGPYIYDLTQPFTISDVTTTLTQDLNGADPKLINVASSAGFPDGQGYLMFNYGYENQEGPVPYISTPSSTTLLISPAYTIKNIFTSGSNVTLLASKSGVVLDPGGNDYEFFLTGDAQGRLYAEALINQIAATGLNVVFTVIFPDDRGLGKWGTQFSEISTVYGQ